MLPSMNVTRHAYMLDSSPAFLRDIGKVEALLVGVFNMFHPKAKFLVNLNLVASLRNLRCHLQERDTLVDQRQACRNKDATMIPCR
jgi:hypothetical protein